MKKQIAIVIAAFTIGLVGARAQESKPDPAQDPMVKAWIEFATPNENHKKLEAFVGSWKIHISYWAKPDVAPQVSDGTAEIQWVLGGRYLEQRQDATMMGQPMSGIGYMGFDNIKRKYVNIWLDNMGTSIMQTWGTSDPSGKAIKTKGAIDDVLTRKPLRYEDAMTIVNPNQFTYEAWTSTSGSAKMVRVMEIVYTRK